MANDETGQSRVPSPQAAEIDLVISGKQNRLSYEQAFALGCTLLEKGHVEDAAKLFARLEAFTDRGPRAFIMQAFCEAAALHFDACSRPLMQAFEKRDLAIASDLHNAFVSYHVGIRQDALNTLTDLVNKHHHLPTLCLLLGDMFEAAEDLAMARKCWSLAVHRDRPGGAVGLVAMRHLRRSPTE